MFQSATYDESGKIYWKVVNVSGSEQKIEADIANFGDKKKAHIVTLSDEDENVINEIGTNYGAKHNVLPREKDIKIAGNKLEYTLDKNSVTVFVIE